MAGYHGYSKSHNALAAEGQGIYPASVLARKLRVTTAAVTALMPRAEWHHTSGWYTETDYYAGAVLIALAAGDLRTALREAGGAEDAREQREVLARLRAYTPPHAGQSRTWSGCTVRWLEWGGTRHHPTAVQRTADNCEIEWRGRQTLYIDGAKASRRLTKRLGTNGFEIDLPAGRPLVRSWTTADQLAGMA
jgi:hypothetical protein